MASTTLQVRIDSPLRNAADKVFADIGMDTNSAIRLFLRQVVIRQTFPFQVISSSSMTMNRGKAIEQAIRDYESGAHHYHAHELVNEHAQMKKNKKGARRHD